MKVSVLLIVFLSFFDTYLNAACNPCGCNPAGVPTAHTPITVYNWPQDEFTMTLCCDVPHVYTGQQVADMLGLTNPLSSRYVYGTDTDKYVQDILGKAATKPCGCQPGPEISFPSDNVKIVWSGSVDTCDPKRYEITGTFMNYEVLNLSVDPDAYQHRRDLIAGKSGVIALQI